MQKIEEKLQGYHRLIVHQRADELAFEIYKLTRGYPKEEMFGLVSQMRRAAISVPANIAEGYTRKTKKEKARFYNMAQGSLTELEYYLEFSLKLNYINKNQLDRLIEDKEDVGRLLFGLVKSATS